MSAIERMIEEMQRRGYAKKTIKEYTSTIRRLSDHFGCCPSKLSLDQVREYQSIQAKRKDIAASYYNLTVTALRFLYLKTLGRDWAIERLPYGPLFTAAFCRPHLPCGFPAWAAGITGAS